MTMEVIIDKPVGVVTDAVAAEMTPSILRGLLKAANYAGGEIAKSAMANHGSAQLARSFLPAKPVITEGGKLAAGALSDLVYAGILNDGGTIRPRTVNNLAIPVKSAPLSTKRRWPRDWPDGELQWIPSKKSGNNGVLVTVTGKGKDREITPQYVLKESVTLPGSGYIEQGAINATERVAQILADELGEGIKEGLGGG